MHDGGQVLLLRDAWRFGPFTLDLDRAVLRGADGAEIPLRPKTFALLTHMVRNAGRVQEREALLDAVWPDVTVTDESLTQAVAELRRALGTEGARLLRTVPKRGYLLDVEVTRGEAPPLASAGAELAGAAEAAGPEVAPAVPGRGGARGWRLAAAGAGAGLLAAVALGVALWPAAQAPVPVPVAAWEEAPPAPVETPRMAARRLFEEGQQIFYAHGSKQENWLAARRLYLEAIAADPTLVPPYAAAVFSYTNMVMTGLSIDPEDDLRRAEALSQRMMVVAPDHPQARNARAALLREQGRFEEALEAYRAALALDGTLFTARANAGYMLILLGRPQEGAELVQLTLEERGPDHSFAGTWQTYLGIAALHAGMPGAAVQHLRLAVGRDGFLPFGERQLHLAAALALSGDVATARLLVAEVARRQPEIDETWLRRRALSQRPAYLEQREALFRGLAMAGFGR